MQGNNMLFVSSNSQKKTNSFLASTLHKWLRSSLITKLLINDLDKKQIYSSRI